jgi:hypothetical protein
MRRQRHRVNGPKVAGGFDKRDRRGGDSEPSRVNGGRGGSPKGQQPTAAAAAQGLAEGRYRPREG